MAFKAAREEAAGESGAGVRGRGGDRFAALSPRSCDEPGGAWPQLKKCVGRRSCRRPARIATEWWRSLWAPKGVVELELISSGERWGRGPKHDVHSSMEARGRFSHPGIWCRRSTRWSRKMDIRRRSDGFFDKAKPLTAGAEEDDRRSCRGERKRSRRRRSCYGVEHWVHDVSWR